MSERWQDQIALAFGAEGHDFAQNPLDRVRAIALLKRMRDDGLSDDEIIDVLIAHLGTIPQAEGQRAQNEERIRALVSETRGGASFADRPIELGTGFWSGLSIVLAIAAAILVLVGLNMIYREGYGSRIVGGDAFNYQIWATRGVAWTVAGTAAAGLACWSALMGRAARG